MNKKLFIEKIKNFNGWEITGGTPKENKKEWVEMTGRICPVSDSCSDVTGSKCASDAKEVVTCSNFEAKLDFRQLHGSFVLDGDSYTNGFLFVPPRDCGNSLVAKV
jgi:hypothetical protein